MLAGVGIVPDAAGPARVRRASPRPGSPDVLAGKGVFAGDAACPSRAGVIGSFPVG